MFRDRCRVARMQPFPGRAAGTLGWLSVAYRSHMCCLRSVISTLACSYMGTVVMSFSNHAAVFGSKRCARW